MRLGTAPQRIGRAPIWFGGRMISGRRSPVLRLSALLGLLVLAACAGLPANFEMYPQALNEGQPLPGGKAVVLVGNGGPAGINYLQFVHSGLPAINVNGIDVPPMGIAAVPVPVGLTGFSLEDYTISGRGGGYLPNGMALGYIAVHTPKIDITTPGLYYIATVFPGSEQDFTTAPNPAMLRQFKAAHPQLAKLKPVNFSW